MPSGELPLHREFQEKVRAGELDPDDLVLLRDAIIGTRELLSVVRPLCDFIVDQADFLVEGMEKGVPRGGCVSAALATVFGPEIIPVTRPVVHLHERDIPEFTRELDRAARAQGMKWEDPTSAADFVALMEDQSTVGALLALQLGETEGHMIGLRPVFTVRKANGEVKPLTEWGQLKDDVMLGRAIAITDTRFSQRPVTKFGSYDLLPELFSDTAVKAPGGTAARVFQRDTGRDSRHLIGSDFRD